MKVILLFAIFCSMNISISAQISRYDMPAQQPITNPNYELMIRMMENKSNRKENNSYIINKIINQILIHVMS